MKREWPFNLQYLIDYVDNKLSAEEDLELSAAIRENEDLRLIVEAIEHYRESNATQSIEAFLSTSKSTVWERLGSYLSHGRPLLSESEKSFWKWIAAKGLVKKVLLIGGSLIGLLVLWFILAPPFAEFSRNVKISSYIFQFLILALAGRFFLTFKPKIIPAAKHYRAMLGQRQIWPILLRLTTCWGVLYLLLAVFSYFDYDDAILFFNAANNGTIVYLYLSYYCLNTYSINQNMAPPVAPLRERELAAAIQRPLRTKEILGWAIVAFFFSVEWALVKTFDILQSDIHLLFVLFSGLSCMVVTTLLVSRIGSKFLSKEQLAIFYLFLYAGIQPLLLFIFPGKEINFFAIPNLGLVLSMILVFYALFGKVLLLTFLSWSLESNRIIKYLEKVKELEEEDEEQELLAIKEQLAPQRHQ